MKKYIVFAALIAVAISTNNSINAYTYYIRNDNKNNTDLIIQVELQGSNNPYFYYTPQGYWSDFRWLTSDFNPMQGIGLMNIKCVIVSDALRTLLLKDNIIKKVDKHLKDSHGLVSTYQIIDNQKTLDWFNNHPEYPRKLATIQNYAGTPVKGVGSFTYDQDFVLKLNGDDSVTAEY